MRNVVLFGAGKIAEVAYFHLTNDSPYNVVAFTVDDAYIEKKEMFGLPLVTFETVQNEYPPDDFKMFVAVGYQDINKFRAQKYTESKAKGYELISYISSRAANFGKVEIGDNCFILENVAIQPCSTIGSNVFIWSGNHIGHHATIGNHCYISGQVVISGSSTIGPYCFIGVNATIGHEITVGAESFIGAGAQITKSVEPRSVYIVQDTPKFRLNSSDFLKITKMK
ncbi:MAG: acetyltransferase [Deltaproteobacteria bacterium]|nr:acetyltransferase [Deltaproteobacteria bacterium]